MKKVVLILLLCCSYTFFAQVQPRKLINGKIIATQNIENVTIYNVTSQKGAVSNVDGEFSIYAKVKDTLVFSSLAFQTKRIILRVSDLEMVTFSVKLEEKINELEEVVVGNNSLTGNLKVDMDNIKTIKIDPKINFEEVAMMEFEKDLRSSPNIYGMYNPIDIYAMDFVKIGRMLGKALNIGQKSNNDQKSISKDPIYNFKDLVMTSFEMVFFEKDLNLKQEEIGVFLDYCALDEKLISNFYNKGRFEKIESLVLKKKEYINEKP